MMVILASFHLRPPRSILRTFVIRFHSLELTTVPLLAIFYFYYSATYSSVSFLFSMLLWVVGGDSKFQDDGGNAQVHTKCERVIVK